MVNGYCTANGVSGYVNNQGPYAVWYMAGSVRNGSVSGFADIWVNGKSFVGAITSMSMNDNATSTIEAQGTLDGADATATITLVEGPGDKSKLPVWNNTIDAQLGVKVMNGGTVLEEAPVAPMNTNNGWVAAVSSSDKIAGPSEVVFDPSTGIPAAGSSV